MFARYSHFDSSGNHISHDFLIDSDFKNKTVLLNLTYILVYMIYILARYCILLLLHQATYQ